MTTIADVQSNRDLRNIPINQVGIKGLRFPIQIDTASGIQHSVARFTMTVYLPADQKGTHMSRFVEILENNRLPLNGNNLHQIAHQMLEKLGSHSGEIHVSFPFFRQKTAPISQIQSLLDYDVKLSCVVQNGKSCLQTQVIVPVTSLCPCSKEISDYGAHNQRSHVTVSIVSQSEIAIADIIDVVENQASCQLYGLLKRPDEKFVTEKAYENPKFVEDMVRDISAQLRKMPAIERFVVESENFESIHNHSAYALVAYPE